MYIFKYKLKYTYNTLKHLSIPFGNRIVISRFFNYIRKPKLLISYFCLLLVIFLSSCTNKTTNSAINPITRTDLMLDTVITLTVYDENANDILDGAFNLCNEYEQMLSKTIETSDIYKINHADNNFVAVSDDTIELLEKSFHYAQISDGIFDITVGAAVDLWDFKSDSLEHQLPNPEDMAYAIKTIDYTQVIIDGNNVRLSKKDAQIDLGGIAKGFIADKIREYMKQQNVDGAIINLGGNILTVGQKPGSFPWIVGIQKPFSQQNDMIASFNLGEKTVVSSGVYERFFILDDILYHHLLNTQTGYPMDTDILSVTIISDNSVDADALSTVAFGLGVEKALDFINNLPNVEAVLVTDDDEIFYTSGIGSQIEVNFLDESYKIMSE